MDDERAESDLGSEDGSQLCRPGSLDVCGPLSSSIDSSSTCPDLTDQEQTSMDCDSETKGPPTETENPLLKFSWTLKRWNSAPAVNWLPKSPSPGVSWLPRSPSPTPVPRRKFGRVFSPGVKLRVEDFPNVGRNFAGAEKLEDNSGDGAGNSEKDVRWRRVSCSSQMGGVRPTIAGKRVHAIRRESSLHGCLNSEAERERFVHNSAQMSHNLVGFGLDEAEGELRKRNRTVSLTEPISVLTHFLPSASCSPSPTRVDAQKQCYSPSTQQIVKPTYAFSPSPRSTPSPTRRNMLRSLSPIAVMRPVLLGGKRKHDSSLETDPAFYLNSPKRLNFNNNNNQYGTGVGGPGSSSGGSGPSTPTPDRDLKYPLLPPHLLDVDYAPSVTTSSTSIDSESSGSGANSRTDFNPQLGGTGGQPLGCSIITTTTFSLPVTTVPVTTVTFSQAEDCSAFRHLFNH